MSGETRPDPKEPTDDALLQRWEERIAAEGDPMGALAEVLGERQATRSLLFSRIGAVVLGIRLERILGAGGMGVTYAGRDADGHEVAVKLVPKVDGTALERFEQECRVLRLLTHPAIVRYRAHAVTEERVGVLVMDLVPGLDLERLFEVVEGGDGQGQPIAAALLREVDPARGPVWQSPRLRRRWLRLLADVADGLHAAHERGVVHRDVKPTNILVGPDLAPIVIDFGLARDLLGRVSFTQSGAAMGTLAYMAPEQLGRDPGAVDRRTDVYALGMILYRAMTGRELRERVGDVVRNGSRGFFLSRQQSQTLPVEVQAILYRCLDPRPARRYATAGELAADLRGAAGQGSIAARLPSLPVRLLRDPQKSLAAAVTATLLLVLAAWTLWPRGRWVVFVGNVDAAEATIQIDNGPMLAPGGQAWLPYGEHRAALVGANVLDVERSFVVEPGPGKQWVALPSTSLLRGDTKYRQPGRTLVHWQSGHSWIEPGPGIALDQRWIDDVPVVSRSPHSTEFALLPGRYELRTRDGRGREERQVVDLPLDPVDIQTLPAVLASVDGAFRCTWSTIYSPRPAALSVQSDAVSWFGSPSASTVLGFGAMQAPCAFAPSGNGTSTLTLQVAFPEPMRSAVVYLRGLVLPGGSLRVRAGFEGGELRAWPIGEGGRLVPMQAFASATGATGWRLEAELCAEDEPTPNFARVRLLDGMLFGGHWRDEPPCFAMAADPGDAARLPSATPPFDPTQLPRLGRHRLLATWQDSCDQPPGLVLRHPDGSAEWWVSTSAGGRSSGVARRSWPDLTPLPHLPTNLLGEPRLRPPLENLAHYLVAVGDWDGDGRQEIAVSNDCDTTRGAAAGLVGVVDGANFRLLQRWPTTPATSIYGDDGYRAVAAVGDWNGDGVTELLADALSHRGPDGQEKCGMVAVVDPRSGRHLAEWYGTENARLRAVDSDWRGATAATALLLRAERRAPGDDSYVTARWLLARRGDAQLLPITEGSQWAAACLVRGAPSEASVVALLEEGQVQGREVGVYLLVVDATGDVRTVVQRQLGWRPRDGLGSDQGWLSGLRSIGDLDGDGVADLVAVLSPTQATGAWFLSGADLRDLGYCPLPGVIRADVRPNWVEAGNGWPQQVLVTTRLDAERLAVHAVELR